MLKLCTLNFVLLWKKRRRDPILLLLLLQTLETNLWGGEGGRKEGGARFCFEGGHYPIRGRVARPPPWNMAFLHLAFECLSSSLVIFVKGGSLKRGEQKESATGTEAGAQKERRIIYSNEEPQLTKCPSFLNVGYLFSKSFESLSSFSR